jgi:hypothetical protein
MKKTQPNYLQASVGEYAPPGFEGVRITAGGCISEYDMKKLPRAKKVFRDVKVYEQIKLKEFSRVVLGRKAYLADRVTGTLYNEVTGLSSSPYLTLVPL